MAEPTSTAATIIVAVASGASAAVGVSIIEQASFAFFGVKAIVVLFAFIGAAAALAYNEPISPKLRMLFVVAANAMLGIVASQLLEFIPFFGWVKGIPGQGISFLAAFIALSVTPMVLRLLPSIAEKNLRNFAGDKPDQGGRDA